MPTESDVKLSVYDNVKAVLQNSLLWNTPYTVYSIDYLADSTNSEPQRPYAFLIARKELLEPKWLPVIAIEVSVGDLEVQLGNLSKEAFVDMHVLGRSDGETDRMFDVLKPNLQSLTVYEYGSGIPVAVQVTETEGWSPTRAVVPPERFMREGTSLHWSVSSASFVIL